MEGLFNLVLNLLIELRMLKRKVFQYFPKQFKSMINIFFKSNTSLLVENLERKNVFDLTKKCCWSPASSCKENARRHCSQQIHDFRCFIDLSQRLTDTLCGGNIQKFMTPLWPLYQTKFCILQPECIVKALTNFFLPAFLPVETGLLNTIDESN